MLKSYTFWLKVVVAGQLITAGVHSLSFFSAPKPANDTERQMLELMAIKQNLGAGFTPSMMDLFLALSSCFSFAYLLGGLINLYLLQKKAEPRFVSGIVNINLIVFLPCFLVMLFMTFLPPVVVTGFVAFGLVATRLTLPRA